MLLQGHCLERFCAGDVLVVVCTYNAFGWSELADYSAEGVVCAVRGAVDKAPCAAYAEVGVCNGNRHDPRTQPLFEVSGFGHRFEDEFAGRMERASDEDFFVGRECYGHVVFMFYLLSLHHFTFFFIRSRWASSLLKLSCRFCL